LKLAKWFLTRRFLNDFLQFGPFEEISIFSNGGQLGWRAWLSDITFKGNTLRMIQAKFGLNWPSGFRGEDV
jgi:hypothetical protein